MHVYELTTSAPHVGATDEHVTRDQSAGLCEGFPLALFHVAAVRKGRGDRLGEAFTGGGLARRRRGCWGTLGETIYSL